MTILITDTSWFTKSLNWLKAAEADEDRLVG